MSLLPHVPEDIVSIGAVHFWFLGLWAITKKCQVLGSANQLSEE